MTIKKRYLFASVAVLAMQLTAQEAVTDSINQPQFRAYRVSVPPVINGHLDDDCWDSVGEWSGTFTQQQPDEGKPETEETRVKVLYDNHNIYVAFRAYDSEPSKINRWTAPRDQIKGDCVGVIFDSYADQRTGFAFVLTAGETRVDMLVANADDDDYTWNAVWEGKTSVDDRGWYAEMRIPLSQLRYSSDNEQIWGFHALRLIDRKAEQSHLHLIPRSNKGYIYSMATMTGISDIPKSRRIELMPYASLKLRNTEREEGNPYAIGNRWEYGAGLDGKVGLSSDFTLDFTINPDFGQVEADPSTLNLTAYETVYEEKRPFFLEGQNIFQNMWTGNAEIFYSRRIGASPLWNPESKDGRYVDMPQQTHIISALKVSGKTRKGLSVGLLNSLTAKESAHITEPNTPEYKMTVQPFSSYSVVRLQQDINKGNTIIGSMLTSVNRNLQDAHLSTLTRNAYTGTFDFEQYFHNREYVIRGSATISRIDGTKEAITALQRSAVHNFQREGATHLSVDSSRTSLTGTSGLLLISKAGESKWQSTHRFYWASPGFDANNIGYIQKADQFMARGWYGYVENQPKGIFRNYMVDAFYNYYWDYSGTATTGNNYGIETNITLTNKWYIFADLFHEFSRVETNLLRGGPAVKINPRWGTDLSISSDQSKKFWAKAYHGTMISAHRNGQYAWVEAHYRPMPNLGLMAHFDFPWQKRELEYVATTDASTGEKAYLMGTIEQQTLSLTLRADYNITPELSIQFYGNPYLAYGKYTDFKRATNTMDKVYENRFMLLTDKMISFDETENRYSVTEPGGATYNFKNPDFSFREFRFNLVARWEYRPNSVVYLVWSQDRSGRAAEYESSFRQNTSSLFSYFPNNVLMVKVNYWFAL